MTPKNLWYIRVKNQVSGPFPSKLVSQRLLLGRLQLADEVSVDQENWLCVGDIDELVPDLFKQDQSDPFVQERIAAAKRWADDRGGRDRRDGKAASEIDISQRTGRERRQIEDLDELNYREGRGQGSQHQDDNVRTSTREAKSYTLHTLALMVLVMAAMYAAYMYLPRTEMALENDCEALAAPQVDWSNCNLQGVRAANVDMQKANLKNANLTGASFTNSKLNNVDLSYSILSLADLRGADLRNSSMIGVNLRKADLTAADLSFSNLSYANFTGAVLLGAKFNSALLEKAIWFDGRECAVGSVGKCD